MDLLDNSVDGLRPHPPQLAANAAIYDGITDAYHESTDMLTEQRVRPLLPDTLL